MKRFCFLFLLIFASCTAGDSQSTDTVQTRRGNAQSAVVNLNILNRDASIQALTPEAELLFSAHVGDVNAVTYTETLDEQVFIALSDNPNIASSAAWTIESSVDIPMSYVIDVSDGTLNANLSGVNLPRFDIVASNSTVDVTLPASAFQLAIDSSNSSFNLSIPTNAQVQSAQLISNGGLMSLEVAAGIRFIGNIAITSGGLTIKVPSTTGVQIIVESVVNSEITLPDSPRISAETRVYTTPNFAESTSQILLNGSLDSAAIRIVQE